MNLSQQIKNLVENDRELERRNKKLSDLSMKKVQLERNIKEAKLKLSSEQDELTSTSKENVLLENELLVVEKGVEVAKQGIEELIRKVLTLELENKNLQETFWKRIIDFVADGHRYLEKVESRLSTKQNQETNFTNKRTEKKNQLKADGQKEAAVLYEKYLRRKVEEMKFISEVLPDSNSE